MTVLASSAEVRDLVLYGRFGVGSKPGNYEDVRMRIEEIEGSTYLLRDRWESRLTRLSWRGATTTGGRVVA
jgi:hypothetical protein